MELPALLLPPPGALLLPDWVGMELMPELPVWAGMEDVDEGDELLLVGIDEGAVLVGATDDEELGGG